VEVLNLEFVLHYHQSTKHHFNRFARSSGHLDWATQPDPFRRYAGARVLELPREAVADAVPYAALFDGGVPAEPITDATIGEFLRCSLGLSAWKQFHDTRWALRVNPSSGNLHPTEGYVLRDGQVCHYAPRDHALEERCVLPGPAWRAFTGGRAGFLVALSSIHWREAWKYGERAFRYCQHDVGHAIGALRCAAALLGWTLTLLPRWSDAQLAAVLGLERDRDYRGAEREEPECIGVVTPHSEPAWCGADPLILVAAARNAAWSGVANTLSTGHVDWSIIGRVAEATRYSWTAELEDRSSRLGTGGSELGTRLPVQVKPVGDADVDRSTRRSLLTTAPASPGASGRLVILRRRSAVAFDGLSTLPRAHLFSMLARLQPAAAPWDALDWPPQVHLLLFVHRVVGLPPGVYAYVRDPAAIQPLRAAMRPEFLWEHVSNDASDPSDPNDPPLFLLVPTDVTWTANRVSCDQDIAADGFFSLGMIARFEPSLRAHGESFYRRLFWECGLIGQVLYLEAEAAGARATGIGCFYDDAVHEVAGLSGLDWQSLYHFSMGMPVDDARLTTESGYPWEG
jgi:SagB-type dehydrogenase family enzyme